MKREDLFEAVGDLDEALLDENVSEIPKKAKFRWVLPVAACLVLAAGVIAVPYAMRGGLLVGDTPVTPVQTDVTTPTQTDVTTTAPTTEHEELPPVIEDNPFLMMEAEEIAQMSVEIEYMGKEELEKSEISQFLERAWLTPYIRQSNLTLDKGAYMQWYITMNDGTELKLSLGQQSDMVYLNGQGYLVDGTIQTLVKYGEYLMGQASTDITPDTFRKLTVEDLLVVRLGYGTEELVTLDKRQVAKFLELLQEQEIVERSDETPHDEKSIHFLINLKDGSKMELFNGAINGTGYRLADPAALETFAHTMLQTEYAPTTFDLLPPTEEWLGNVYFGSEFPYFIYGNDDYCVFTEGMDGLFIFDFNKGEITFSANITETFNKAGIAHGMDGWNGVGLSAYRENGEIKLLCTASTGGDGTGTRGFTVDAENGTLTEIPNFDRNNLDFNVYVYNVPADGLPYLFGAAPIPLEDGYICFENSGLNNEVLPYEGSHLPMIMIRKVKGDDVKDWIPFKDVMPIIKSGG